jgi:alpha-N-arabinofuranosidase
MVAAAATHDADSGATALFLTNRDSDAMDLIVDHGSFASFDVLAAETITSGDIRAPRDLSLLPLTQLDSGSRRTTLVLPPESWTVIRAAASA